MTLASDRTKLVASVNEEEIAVMTIRYRQVCLLTAMILLAGCAQNREVPKLTNQVVELKQVLGELTEQATALERQTGLTKAQPAASTCCQPPIMPPDYKAAWVSLACRSTM
jgi:outer membrane murein-binding lipoprotein Lpp